MFHDPALAFADDKGRAAMKWNGQCPAPVVNVFGKEDRRSWPGKAWCGGSTDMEMPV
jgi:hypothetical protein